MQFTWYDSTPKVGSCLKRSLALPRPAAQASQTASGARSGSCGSSARSGGSRRLRRATRGSCANRKRWQDGMVAMGYVWRGDEGDGVQLQARER